MTTPRSTTRPSQFTEGSSYNADSRSLSSDDGSLQLEQLTKQKSVSGATNASRVTEIVSTTAKNGQRAQRTMMKVVNSGRSQPEASEALSKSVPNMNYNGSSGDILGDADNSSVFSALSESVWNPRTGSTEIRAVANGPRKSSMVRRMHSSFGNETMQPLLKQSTLSSANSPQRTTKIKASDLGIKINKDTRAEEVDEAVRRWRMEQKPTQSVSGERVAQNLISTEKNQASSLGTNGTQPMKKSAPRSTTPRARSTTRRARSTSPAIVRKPGGQTSQRQPTPKRTAKSPGRTTSTPSRLRRASIGGNPKGRDLSKSPGRGSDYRPVSWRPEDSDMHKPTSDDTIRVRGRRTTRPRTAAEENYEIQKRLREAGISLEQYRAMLGVGLTVGLA